MSENPFNDLGVAETSSDTNPDESESESKNEDSPEQSPPEQETTHEHDSNSTTDGPAFEYAEVRQRPLYARGDTWDEFERAIRTDIGPTLAGADILDEETREIHDAVLQVAAENPDLVAEKILEARGL